MNEAGPALPGKHARATGDVSGGSDRRLGGNGEWPKRRECGDGFLRGPSMVFFFLELMGPQSTISHFAPWISVSAMYCSRKSITLFSVSFEIRIFLAPF